MLIFSQERTSFITEKEPLLLKTESSQLNRLGHLLPDVERTSSWEEAKGQTEDYIGGEILHTGLGILGNLPVKVCLLGQGRRN